MDAELTDEQRTALAGFHAFVERALIPHAETWDAAQCVPSEALAVFGSQGYWGAGLARQHGGLGLDPVTFGLLCEQIGRASASMLSLLTVQNMVCQSVARWGTAAQKERYLRALASGQLLAAFALSEPELGSDARNVQTSATKVDGGYRLQGRKRWISGAQVAGLFLVMGHCAGQPTAFLVERDNPGLRIQPMAGLAGFRAAMLAELEFDGCFVPEQNVVGKVGFGFSYITHFALDHGRYTIAWGCAGLLRGCVEASARYAAERKQFGVALREHQLIQQLMTNMLVEFTAARALCLRAGRLRAELAVESLMETSLAKYFASRAAVRGALDAVQIHGANGFCDAYPVARYLRDAKIMEVIEGSNQMHQLTLAQYGFQQLGYV